MRERSGKGKDKEYGEIIPTYNAYLNEKVLT